MEFLLSTVNVSWIVPGVSTIFLFIDAIVYAILEGAINIFFLIGGMNFSTLTEKIMNVVNNLKSLVGIYVLFKLSILFLNYLIEPEKFKDKSAGGAKLVKDIVVVIVLLVLLNGNVLFGILNDVQKVVFSTGSEFEVLDEFGLKSSKTDIIQGMILGDVDEENIPHSLTVQILSAFLYVYTDSDDKRTPKSTDKGSSWYVYRAGNSIHDAEQIMGKIAQDMTGGISFFYLVNVGNLFSSIGKVQYTAVLSTIFGVYMIIKFFKYGLSLVLRFLKLFLMQILAPIAIVSYITAEGKKTFNNFWKTYFTIYMELFIRLLVVYISIYMMKVVMTDMNGIIGSGNAIPDAFTSLILMIMLMMGINKFMDEMPNIISNLFGGGKLEDKQKSMGAILGGVLGGGIGLATGLGAARAAGATGLGTALGGVTGMFGGVKSGANSQNLGAFVSGQVSNATKATGRGFDIGNAGGAGAYLQMQADRNFGGANRLRADAGHYKSAQEQLSSLSKGEKDIIAKNSGFKDYDSLMSYESKFYSDAEKYYRDNGAQAFASSSYAKDKRFQGVNITAASDIAKAGSRNIKNLDDTFEVVATKSLQTSLSTFKSLSKDDVSDLRNGSKKIQYSSSSYDINSGSFSAKNADIKTTQIDMITVYDRNARDGEQLSQQVNLKDTIKDFENKSKALESSQRYSNIANGK